MTPSLLTLREEILHIGRRMYERGFVASNDGNISVRLDKDEFLITPTGVSKGFMSSDSLVRIDNTGQPLFRQSKVSTEAKMHLAIYKQRPDISAVVHAHPPYATSFAVARIPLTPCVLPEVVFSLGAVPLVPYALPSSEELAQQVAEWSERTDALLLANHGVVALGADALSAYHKLETVEHFAHILWLSQAIGGAKGLSKVQVADLISIRQRASTKGRFYACNQCQYSKLCHE
ncbi:MAG: class II aldolase/adducin family protein [Candidatus Heimdallarchaeota archaeon]